VVLKGLDLGAACVQLCDVPTPENAPAAVLALQQPDRHPKEFGGKISWASVARFAGWGKEEKIDDPKKRLMKMLNGYIADMKKQVTGTTQEEDDESSEEEGFIWHLFNVFVSQVHKLCCSQILLRCGVGLWGADLVF